MKTVYSRAAVCGHPRRQRNDFPSARLSAGRAGLENWLGPTRFALGHASLDREMASCNHGQRYVAIDGVVPTEIDRTHQNHGKVGEGQCAEAPRMLGGKKCGH